MPNRIYNEAHDYIEFYDDAAQEWRWRIRSSNGEIVAAASEGFTSKQGAFDNLKLTLRIATEAIATLPTVPRR